MCLTWLGYQAGAWEPEKAGINRSWYGFLFNLEAENSDMLFQPN